MTLSTLMLRTSLHGLILLTEKGEMALVSNAETKGSLRCNWGRIYFPKENMLFQCLQLHQVACVTFRTL